MPSDALGGLANVGISAVALLAAGGVAVPVAVFVLAPVSQFCHVVMIVGPKYKANNTTPPMVTIGPHGTDDLPN
jgi:hypothetical protein